MILIGENIHIISKTVREALEQKDENFVKNLIKIQQNLDGIDLNIGPGNKKFDTFFDWICPMCEGIKISFDTTNPKLILSGLENVKNPQDCFINSICLNEKFYEVLDIAKKYNSNLIALAMDKQGVRKSADSRMELVFELYEKLVESGIESEKIFFDPLVLPIKFDQTQGIEVLNTIRMVKEGIEDVKTIVGLSNISNGIPTNLRPLVNRVFGVMAYGAGLDSAIIDAKDVELIRIFKMLDKGSVESELDSLYKQIFEIVKNYGDLSEIKYDQSDINLKNIMACVKILFNQELYSDIFARV